MSHQEAGVIVAKVVAMLVLGLASCMLGLLPVKLASCFQRSTSALQLLLCFGGGALLCTTFLHLLPEVRESVEDLQHRGDIGETDFHLPELVMCCGFFLMFLVEELIHVYLHHREKVARLDRVDVVAHRSLSIRRCSSLSSKYHVSDKPEEKIFSVIIHQSPQFYEDKGSYAPSSPEYQNVNKDYDTDKVGVHDLTHVLPAQDGLASAIRGLLVVLALSIHELFEGLAVGLQSTAQLVYYMMGAVAAHKLVISFCVGMELVSSGTRRTLVIIYVITFAVVSPIGIGVGIAVGGEDASGGVPNVVLQGLATGTLLYVVFFEILLKERKGGPPGLHRLLAILLGFGLMFGLLMAASEGGH